MRAIVGVQIVEAGDVTVLGLPAGMPELRRRVGYVTQAPSVYTDLTVRENLRYFARILGAPARRIDEALDDGRARADADQVVAHAVRRRAIPRLARDARCSAGPSCSCSTNRPSASTRCCAATSGRLFHGLAGGAPRCSSPATSWTRPRAATSSLLMRDGRLVAAEPPERCCARTGAADLEAAFLALAEAGAHVSAARTLATDGAGARAAAARPSNDRALLVVPPVLLTLFRYVFDGRRRRSTGWGCRCSASSRSSRCSWSHRSRCCASGRAGRWSG